MYVISIMALKLKLILHAYLQMLGCRRYPETGANDPVAAQPSPATPAAGPTPGASRRWHLPFP
jgi:hypothetical protein